MRKQPSTSTDDVSHVRDRRGREWTVVVKSMDEDDDLEPWIRLTPEQRIELIGECVLDGLRVKGQSDIPRLRRIYRIVERAPRAVSDRRRLRSRIPRAT